MKILVIEDDELIATVLSEMLTAHHYIVEHATDGKTGLDLAQAFTYDLIVLDLSVPLLDGLSVCRKLRQQGLLTPILVLTARDSEVDKAQALDAGADDYVCKPFNALELLARIRALIRRSQTVSTPSLTWERLVMHPLRGEVTYAKSSLALTPKEFALLELFLRHPQRIFSRSAILDQLWPNENPPSESAVTMHVKDLRQKLKAAGLTHEVIETIYGMGYRLKTPPPTPKASETPPPSSPPSATTEAPRSRSTPVTSPQPPLAIPSLAQLVTRFQPHFRQQIEWLVTLQPQLSTYAPDDPLWQQVRQAVHKLAGTLGTFGYIRGSSLAKEIEQILGQSTNLDTTQQQRIHHLLSALQQTLAEPPPCSPFAAPTLLPTALATGKHILVIDRDPAFLTAMQAIAPDWQFSVTIADNLTDLPQALAQTQPDVVLLDFTFLAESGIDLSVSQPLLQALVKQAPPLPVVVLSHQDSLEDRVTVARLGGCRFLPRPTTIEAVLQVLLEVLQQKQPIAAKIMAVDDDPVLLTSLDSLLKPWGLRLTPLMEPRQFWQVLTQLVPDLLILDLEMPAFSGIDLCQVVRQDPHWGDLPILVLTSHTDSTTIQQVFAAGADDFVGKPVRGPELVTRILNRLERVCLRQRLNH
ncbi:response regulator [Trichothermofontia sp.]